MDAATIDILSKFDPASDSKGGRNRLNLEANNRFISRYVDPSYGHTAALNYANAKRKLPIPMMGRNRWVFRAYMMYRNPEKFYNEDIAEAYQIAQAINTDSHLGNKIKAMIISFTPGDTVEEHLARLAELLGTPYNVMEAFESLFYNILDRCHEAMYVANQVYPKGRMVELDEAYVKNTSVADLLKRTAYNHKDTEFTGYMSGIGDQSFFRKMASSDERETRMSQMIMGNGLIMMMANLVNQRSPALTRSTQLLAASRQAGNHEDNPAITQAGFSLMDDLNAAIGVSSEITKQHLRQAEGRVIDVTP